MGRKKPRAGHNVNQVVNANDLRNFIKRIEKLNADIAAVMEDRKEVYTDAKNKGFSVKAIRSLISERAADPEKLREFKEIVGLYRDALSGTPLGDAAAKRADEEDTEGDDT